MSISIDNSRPRSDTEYLQHLVDKNREYLSNCLITSALSIDTAISQVFMDSSMQSRMISLLQIGVKFRSNVISIN